MTSNFVVPLGRKEHFLKLGNAQSIGPNSPLSSEVPRPAPLSVPHSFSPVTPPPIAHPGAATPRPQAQSQPHPISSPSPQQASPFSFLGGGSEGGSPDWMGMVEHAAPMLMGALGPHVGAIGGAPGIMSMWNLIGGRRGQDIQNIFGGSPGAAPQGPAPITPASPPATTAPSPPPPPPTPPQAPAVPAPQPPLSPVQPPQAGQTTGGVSTPTAPSPAPAPGWWQNTGRPIATSTFNAAAPMAINRGLESGLTAGATRLGLGPVASRFAGGPVGMAAQAIGGDLIDRSSLADPLRNTWVGDNILGLNSSGPLTSQGFGANVLANQQQQQELNRLASQPTATGPRSNGLTSGEYWLARGGQAGSHLMQGVEGMSRPVTTGEWVADSARGLDQATARREVLNNQREEASLPYAAPFAMRPSSPSPYLFQADRGGAVSPSAPMRDPVNAFQYLTNQAERYGPMTTIPATRYTPSIPTVGYLDAMAEGGAHLLDNTREMMHLREIARQRDPSLPQADFREALTRDTTGRPLAGVSNYLEGSAHIPGTNLTLPAVNPAQWGRQWQNTMPSWLGGR